MLDWFLNLLFYIGVMLIPPCIALVILWVKEVNKIRRGVNER